MPKTGPSGVLGIDPGVTGGIAYVRGRYGSWSSVAGWAIMPATQRDILAYLSNHRTVGMAYIEKPNLGHPGTGKSQMAKLWGNYTELCMALVSLRIQFEPIAPVKWIRGLDIKPKRKAETQRQWKDRLRGEAQRLFPKLEVWDRTLGEQRAVCDALLIAEYCRRQYG